MISHFDIMPLDDCYLAVAVMDEGPVVEIGLFDEFDDAELACHQFHIEHGKRLH